MFFQTKSIGNYFDTEVRVHWSVMFVIVLLTINLIPYYSSMGHSGPLVYLFALLTPFVLYLSILAHEFGHIFAMRSVGYECRRITLLIFGGAAEMNTHLIKSAGHEFFITICGPTVSILLSVIFSAFAMFLPEDSLVSGFCAIMAIINLVLGVFNVIFLSVPADGGRLLRSGIWGITGNWLLASKICTLSFPIVALALFYLWLPVTFLNLLLFAFFAFLAYVEYPRHGHSYIHEDLAKFIDRGEYVFNGETVKIDVGGFNKEFYVLNDKGNVTGFLRGAKYETV